MISDDFWERCRAMGAKTKGKKKRRRADTMDGMKKNATGKAMPFLKLPKGVQAFRVDKPGKMLLDFLPYVVGDNNPNVDDEGALWFELTFWYHPNVGPDKKKYTCNAETFQTPCPICEMRQELDQEDNDENEELLKELRPKKRQLFQLYDRDNMEAGVQVWEVSYFNFGELLLDVVEEKNSVFWDPEEGQTTRVTFKQKKFRGGPYREAVAIDFKKRKEGYDEDEVLEATCNLEECIVQHDYDELKTILTGGATDEKPKKKRKKKYEDDDDEDKEDDSDERGKEKGPRPSKKKSKAEKKGKKGKTKKDKGKGKGEEDVPF